MKNWEYINSWFCWSPYIFFCILGKLQWIGGKMLSEKKNISNFSPRKMYFLFSLGSIILFSILLPAMLEMLQVCQSVKICPYPHSKKNLRRIFKTLILFQETRCLIYNTTSKTRNRMKRSQFGGLGHEHNLEEGHNISYGSLLSCFKITAFIIILTVQTSYLKNRYRVRGSQGCRFNNHTHWHSLSVMC